jgi:hypothetical protein
LGGLFVIPNNTRWNSFYDALKSVKDFMLLKTDEFQEIFEHFGVPYLSSSEEDLIKEYVKILLPLTRALDILQADKKVSIGFLLPTIVVLKKQLERLQTNQRIKHCKPLINGLLSRVNNRFGDMFSDDELRLAAFLHPRFKLSWIADEEKEQAMELLISTFEREEQKSASSSSGNIVGVSSAG